MICPKCGGTIKVNKNCSKCGISYDEMIGQISHEEMISLFKKMHKKILPRAIMICSCIAMLCINIFAWNFSSISLMLVAAVVSLTLFILNGAPDQKGGAKK